MFNPKNAATTFAPTNLDRAAKCQMTLNLLKQASVDPQFEKYLTYII